jgi:hypothetical protein
MSGNLLDKMGFKGKLLKWFMRLWLIVVTGLLELLGILRHSPLLALIGFTNFVVVFCLMIFISLRLVEKEHERLGFNN